MTRCITIVALALAAAGCAPRQDITPQIEVSPNVGDRLALFPGHAGEAATKVASGAAAAPAYARAGAEADALNGDQVSGKPGDLLLGNDEIVLVLRAKEGAAFSLEDLADATNKIDGLGSFVPAALARKDSGRVAGLVIDTAQVFAGEDGSATVAVSGHADGVHVMTTFKLAKTDRAVLVTTTFENTTDAKQGPFDVRDEIAWGSSRPFVPGHVAQSAGTDAREYKGSYIGAVGAASSYAVTSTTGEVDTTIVGKNALVHLDRDLVLAPHSQKSFDCVLVVGTRPDSSSVVAELVRASDGDLGSVDLHFARSAARASGGPTPVTLLVRAPGGEDALSIVSTAAEHVVVDLPPGVFTIRSAGQEPSAATSVTVRKDKTTELTVQVP